MRTDPCALLVQRKTREMNTSELYNPTFVRSLFDEMSRTYGVTNYISSFGFCKRWREQCVAQVPIRPSMTVYDLMTGMGECWRPISRQLHMHGHLIALDFSPEMCRRARSHIVDFQPLNPQVVEEDVLLNTLEPASADCIISTFGLKTFSDDQQQALAQEIARLLRPQGTFSLLEISVPSSPLLRMLYMFYLKYVIPVIGKLLLGNPDNYRLLGVYTARFGNCRNMAAYLHAAGLHVEYKQFFFGCATGLVGTKLN